MRAKYAIIMIFVLVASLCAYSAISKATTTSKDRDIYAAYIDEVISKCEPKIARCDSGSPCIRQEAALYCLKASFCSYHKTDLVKEIASADIGTKEHQMYPYIKGRFFNILRTAAKSLDS